MSDGALSGITAKVVSSEISAISHHNAIQTAISEKKLLRLRYHGQSRVVEPFCYGWGRDGQELLRAYQRDGGSRSRLSPGWKLFRVEEIEELHVEPDPRAAFCVDDPAMIVVICHASEMRHTTHGS